MKISIYAPYAKERFETSRQYSILRPERIVGLNCEQSAKVFSRCSMKMRTLVDNRRAAGLTARIGTVRSKGVRRRRNSTLSEFCGEEPCWRLGDAQMFKNAHTQLLDIAGSKNSFGNNRLPVLS
jgi:hypothetical protein